MGRVYMCIDLKSFYASVECVARGYDPFQVPLVVADPTRGDGAITLAISPALKELGVKNRCRIFEIPKHLQYEIAIPRMRKYIEVSAQIYGIYLQYISPDDIHVYSIDEVFIDATPYLKTYNCKAKDFAKLLMQAVMDKTGICATAGIGTNLYLAKIAMDIVAKHVPEHIGILTEELYKKCLWKHQPLTDFWNVGRGTANRLAKYGVFDMKGITELPEELLYKEFGVKAIFLIDHAWGREPCTMEQIHNYKGKSRSLSNSQILFEDYDVDSAHKKLNIPLAEDVDTTALAEKYEFAGREIRNTVISACVMAAMQNREIVTQNDLITACDKLLAEKESLAKANDHTVSDKTKKVIKQAVIEKMKSSE